MKRIAIVTIQSMNYGNRLQNYALQEVLKEFGSVKTLQKNSNSIGILAELKKCIHILRSKTRADYFALFNRYIQYDRCILAESPSIAEKYDYFVAGSDQIWNPLFDFNGGRELLTFAKPNQKIAFSASIGLDKLPNEYIEKYKSCLCDFKAISMREDLGTRIVKEITNRSDVISVLDPTLLLSKIEWNRICKKSRFQPKSRYIFKYILGIDNEDIEREINKYALERGLAIFDLKESTKGDKRPIGPAEFVSLIANSDVVFTDSFHGTVFSMIYERTFFTIIRPPQNGYGDMSSRIYSLLKCFNMMDRILYKADEIKNMSDICSFTEMYSILEEQRKLAIEFLKKNLE